MTNHPNRTAAYRISLQNGRFDHVRGKAAAVARAKEMIGDGCWAVTARDLIKHWGVRIDRVSAETAHSVGL